jgi:hypothetical protein
MNEFFPKVIKKRNGKVAPFNIEKIKAAIYKAAYTLGGRDEEKAVEVSNEVARRLNNDFTLKNCIPTVDDSNAVCVAVLREKGFDRTADKFESYALDRSRVRRSGLTVKKKAGKADITDQMLLVASITNETIEPFDRSKLALALEKEYRLRAFREVRHQELRHAVPAPHRREPPVHDGHPAEEFRPRHAAVHNRVARYRQQQGEFQHHLQQPGGGQPRHSRVRAQTVQPAQGLLRRGVRGAQ